MDTMSLKRIAVALASAALIATPAFASKSGTVSSGGGGGGGGGGSGGGSGGGTTTTVGVLPTTPPAPDVVLRESFGLGADALVGRPQGDKGDVRSPVGASGLNAYWLEYPGSWTSAWSSAAWQFADGSTNSLDTLPLSPIDPGPDTGVAFSEWRDGVVAYPDAIVPFQGVASKYSVSAFLYPAYLDGSYVALGLTTSNTLAANLPSNGQVWIQLSQIPPYDGAHGQYAVLSGSQVLASGYATLNGYNPVAITVDPVAQTVEVALDGVDLGTWAMRVTPKFIAFEGQGVADEMVVRTVQ
jgi:hypothetical protein